MKKILLSATALTALSFSALAADLPRRAAAPVVPAPVFTWTGVYVGGTVGALSATFKNTESYTDFDTSANSYSYGNKNAPASATVGATIGYNQQFGNIVAGLEADYSYANASATNNYDGYNKTKLSNFGTVRGRLGVAVDRTLFFATAGLAVANISGENNLIGPASFSKTKYGWVAGAGVEYALTNNLTLKAEALYADFGSLSSSYEGARVCAGCTSGFKSKTSAVVGRVGVNYKF